MNSANGEVVKGNVIPYQLIVPDCLFEAGDLEQDVFREIIGGITFSTNVLSDVRNKIVGALNNLFLGK